MNPYFPGRARLDSPTLQEMEMELDFATRCDHVCGTGLDAETRIACRALSAPRNALHPTLGERGRAACQTALGRRFLGALMRRALLPTLGRAQSSELPAQRSG